MSTEQQFQLNVNIKEEMDDLGTREKMEPKHHTTMTDKLFAVKEETPSDDTESLSPFASKQPASPSIVVKRETCQCTGPDCLDCIEAHQSEEKTETIGNDISTFESLLSDDSDKMPSDWFSGEASDSEEAIVDAALTVSAAASVSNFPIKAEPLPADEEPLSPFASPQPASPSIIVKGETCQCSGDCPDCQAKRSHPCPECGKTFSYYSQLKIHQVVHTIDRPYVCAQCPKTFKESCTLQRHQLTHQAVRRRPFSCTAEGCGKAFTRKHELKIHSRLHTGERPYKCASCGQAFPESGQLTIHMRRHTGHTPYKCDHCNKSFTARGNLTIHMRTHTGARPYRCPVCPKAFARSSHAKRHQQTAHPESS